MIRLGLLHGIRTDEASLLDILYMGLTVCGKFSSVLLRCCFMVQAHAIHLCLDVQSRLLHAGVTQNHMRVKVLQFSKILSLDTEHEHFGINDAGTSFVVTYVGTG